MDGLLVPGARRDNGRSDNVRTTVDEDSIAGKASNINSEIIHEHPPFRYRQSAGRLSSISMNAFQPGTKLPFRELARIDTVHIEVQHRNADIFESVFDHPPSARALAASPVAWIDGPVDSVFPGEFFQVPDPSVYGSVTRVRDRSPGKSSKG